MEFSRQTEYSGLGALLGLLALLQQRLLKVNRRRKMVGGAGRYPNLGEGIRLIQSRAIETMRYDYGFYNRLDPMFREWAQGKD